MQGPLPSMGGASRASHADGGNDGQAPVGVRMQSGISFDWRTEEEGNRLHLTNAHLATPTTRPSVVLGLFFLPDMPRWWLRSRLLDCCFISYDSSVPISLCCLILAPLIVFVPLAL